MPLRYLRYFQQAIFGIGGYFLTLTGITNFNPDYVSSNAHTLISTNPFGSARFLQLQQACFVQSIYRLVIPKQFKVVEPGSFIIIFYFLQCVYFITG